MKNADMPAMPQEWEAYVEGHAPAGLSKREYFAGLAMQAFITADHLNGSEKRLNEDNALMAVDAADALLAELDKDRES